MVVILQINILMLCTWSTEQAIREIYLRPFELSVKDGDCKAVMSAWNYISNQWAGACPQLLQIALRNEWALRGLYAPTASTGIGTWIPTRPSGVAVT